MKNETFFEFIHKTTTAWKDKSKTQEQREEYEQFLLHLESFRENAKNFDVEQKLMIEAVLDFAKSALKALLFINAGGVFVVMMAVSAIVSKDSKFTYLLPALAKECQYFVWGIVFSVCSVCGAYIAQRIYAAGLEEKYGDIANVASIVMGVMSLLAFIFGAISLRDVFLILPCPAAN